MSKAEELLERMSALTSLLLSEDTDSAALRVVAEMAVGTVGQCDAAGVSIASQSGVGTQAATDDFALQLDELQYRIGAGPCLDAITTGVISRFDPADLYQSSSAFAEEAAGLGLAGSLSAPLRVVDQVVGSLNMYSRRGVFGGEDELLAALVAGQAAVCVAAAQAVRASHETVEQLNHALASRDMIGQAKGILMAREGCNSDEAFDMLRRASQRMNQKLRDVAEQIVTSGQRRPG